MKWKWVQAVGCSGRMLGIGFLIGFCLLIGSSGFASDTELSPVLSAALESRMDSSDPALDQVIRTAVERGLDEELVRSLLEKGDPRVLPTETLVTWIDHAGRLAEEGLPAGPVVSRYLQGLAKGVPVPRIEAAVAELEDRLRQAAFLVDAAGVGRPADPAQRLIMIDHTAYALGLDVVPETVERSLALAREEPSPAAAAQAPVLTLGILVSSGLSAATSFQVVETAWEHGYRGSTLERLGKALGEANPEGGAPSEKVVNEVLALLSEESSEDRFFEGLDEIMGRQGYRLPSIGIENDAVGRRGDRQTKDPIMDTPKDQDNQRPVIGD